MLFQVPRGKLGTLISTAFSHAAATDFLRAVTSSKYLQFQWVSPDRFYRAAKIFDRHEDKEWSFTDCVSLALMHELQIQDSFTTDRHFQQAGFNPLLAN